MARNLAHIVILLYGAWMLFRCSEALLLLLSTRMDRRSLDYLRRGPLNRFLLLSAKKQTPPLFFWWNAASVAFFALHAVLAITVGWFSFAGGFLRFLNSFTVLLIGAEAFLLSCVSNQLRFEQPFVLFRRVQNGLLPFASTVLDGAFYAGVPLFVLICNLVILQ